MNAFRVKNERKLLVKNKNTAYSFRRFSAFPLYCKGIFQSVTGAFRLSWYKAASAMDRKNRLKNKCARQDMFLSTPPQEQGTRGQNPASTNPIYPVKSDIIIADKNKPARCHLPPSSRPIATSSAAGMISTSASATSGGKFWLCISWRNSLRTAILLTAA
jgi:hypothetical protein